jgi:hypothetical protein
VSNWDTSNVTSLKQTFYGATSFLGKIWKWNVERVTNLENTFDNTPALKLCFKRFIYDSWYDQGVTVSDEWSSISSCTRSLTEALNDEPCFGSLEHNTPCTCTSIDPKNLRCLHCGM